MWQDRGSAYDSSDTFHQALASQLVHLAKVRSGDIVLDVATGTGMVALPVAHLVGEERRVVGVDISESMLAEVRAMQMRLQLQFTTF